jgi:dethiobiotin synthetase
MQPFFITGIGTGIGKTLVAAIVTEALEADYWKPVQAGFENGTDTGWMADHISNSKTKIHPETYRLNFPASPHIAAARENIRIDCKKILNDLNSFENKKPLIIEGAGGLMVPLNDQEFVIDLIQQLNAKLILVSRNYLGSINHSLLTASVCRSRGLDVAGWIFNDDYLNYEQEIQSWSGYPSLISVPFIESFSRETIQIQALKFRPILREKLLGNSGDVGNKLSLLI